MAWKFGVGMFSRGVLRSRMAAAAFVAVFLGRRTLPLATFVFPLLVALLQCSGPDRNFGAGSSGTAGAVASDAGRDPQGGSLATGGASGGTPGMGGGGGPPAECSLGEVQCAGLVPQDCSEQGRWVPRHAGCATECLDGECVECVEGESTCKDGAVQECASGQWSTLELCAKACEDGACVAGCTEDRLQCNGARWLQKCVGGSYVDETECPFSCTEGECIGECMPDTRRCNPEAEGEAQTCGADALWGASEPCPANTFCVAGGCKPCKPGTTRCSDAGPQQCSEAGEWVNQGACVAPTPACLNGGCVACTPGEKRCAAAAVEQCLMDGSGWERVATCSGATPVCLETTKACGRCTQGQTQCFGNEVRTCDDQGVWTTTQTCSGTTPRCVNSACAQCDPAAGERRCETQSRAQSCGATGSWGSPTTCSGDKPLCREDLNFSCGCEEGERRCRTNTIPEVCQGGSWVAQSACSGVLNHCLPASGQCVDCVPGTAECQGGTAYECTAQGAWRSLNSCAGPGINCGGCDLGEPCRQNSDCGSGVCVNDMCAVCQPSQRRCQGNIPQLCSASGAWTNQSACSGATPLCLPSTGQCVQCENGMERTCGSCNLGTQSCSGTTWGSCSGAPDLQTNNQHCGTCNNPCATGRTCSGGACRSANGALCNTNADCINNNCTTFYFDSDNDSFGSAASGTRKVCGITPPSGNWRTNNRDCCDSNPVANPNYTGGPRDVGATPGPTCTLSFDWDCDGVERRATPVAGCPSFTTEASCPGVVFGSATACGVQAGATACGWDRTNGTCVNARGALWTQTCD